VTLPDSLLTVDDPAVIAPLNDTVILKPKNVNKIDVLAGFGETSAIS